MWTEGHEEVSYPLSVGHFHVDRLIGREGWIRLPLFPRSVF
jgi:hypothetical protein